MNWYLAYRVKRTGARGRKIAAIRARNKAAAGRFALKKSGAKRVRVFRAKVKKSSPVRRRTWYEPLAV